jgi:primosomal protein N' (replication factor Y) (superfamily II helicase)
VARVCVDLPLPHLDRPFDYLVPDRDAAAAQPGVRVRVRFAGQLVDGWLLERLATSEHTGTLLYLERVVSAEPVLAPEVLRAARAVAARYGGGLADVLRLAVPPRHARVESEPVTDAAAAPEAEVGADPAGGVGGADAGAAGGDAAGWGRYPAGAALLRALADGRAPRAVWSPLPGEDWPARVAEAAAATVRGGRGVVTVVADARDLARLDEALTVALGPGRHVALSAALGPAERYRRFLRASRGQVPVVAGTRAAALAPVPDLGLVAIWDDGDDLHAEPRAPYPHAREVLLTRAQLAGAAAVVAGFARTAEGQQLVETGWARAVVAERATVRVHAPRVTPTGDEPQLARDPAASAARLPSEAWRAARQSLDAGAPVLVQVPRRGYLPAVGCATCRARARCGHCAGPLELPSAQAAARCRWCGRPVAGFACPHCGGRRLRAAATGVLRTAEELGRAFPGHPVRTSGRDEVLGSVPDRPALVVATPGAEPVPAGGYGAVLLLDTWALLTRADLRAGEETLRRWLAAAALARPASAGGRVVVVADGGLPPVQALVRFDPGWYAERELAERRELGFPPAARVATVTGAAAAVAELLAAAVLPEGAEVLGPVPLDDEQERLLVRVPRASGTALAAALHAAAGVRSARKAADPVRVQVDPLDLL